MYPKSEDPYKGIPYYSKQHRKIYDQVNYELALKRDDVYAPLRILWFCIHVDKLTYPDNEKHWFNKEED